ncbi:MAG: LLM class F420-dependent oxidoreductase [Actinomycetota bacterium]
MTTRRVTRFGLQIPSFSFPGVPEDRLFGKIAEIAVTAEESGFDSVWVMDHYYQIPMVGRPDEPMFEAYTTLGAIAARTGSVRLGTMVSGVTYRNPAFLAKTVTTLDVVSSGRAILGIGGAWNEQEHRGYGWDFPPTGERLDRLEEALKICRAMFTEERPSFSGRHYRIEEALNSPRPVTPGGPPILIGGGGERRTLRLVAQYADACNIFGDVETVKHKLEVLRRHCEEVGRDYGEITKTRLGGLFVAEDEAAVSRGLQDYAQQRGIPPDMVRGYVAAGTPDQVVEQVGELFDAGLDGVVFNMIQAHEIEPVAVAGKALVGAFGS